MLQNQKKSRSDILRSILKNTILTFSILIIAISTISGSINANARQQEILNQELFNNPQAILNVTFNDNVYLDNIIDNELNSDKNWQGLKFDNSTFGITSLSGLSNIGGVEEMVSINGQYSTRSIKKSYKNKLQELIVKIDDIKNNNQTNENEKVKSELSKMNSWEVKKQRFVNWSQSKIVGLSIIGNQDTLKILQEILQLSGHSKNLLLTNIGEFIKTSTESNLENNLDNIDFNQFKENYNNQSEMSINPLQTNIETTNDGPSNTSSLQSILFGINAHANYEWINNYLVVPSFKNGNIKVQFGQGLKSLLISGGITSLAWRIISAFQYFCMGFSVGYFNCIAISSFVTGGVLFQARDWLVHNWCSNGFALNINFYSRKTYYDC
jgi:hypothetical protein